MKGAHPAYLVRAKKSGGSCVTVADLPGKYGVKVFSDNHHVFWADAERRQVMWAPLE